MDVLTSYLRLPRADEKVLGETEVREAVVAVLRRHLQIGVKPSWSWLLIDLRGASLEVLDLTGAVLYQKPDFRRATFRDTPALKR